MKADPDSLAHFIRKVDGNNTLGAGALAENICQWLAICSHGASLLTAEDREWMAKLSS